MNYDEFLVAVNAPSAKEFVESFELRKRYEEKYSNFCNCIRIISNGLNAKGAKREKKSVLANLSEVVNKDISVDQLSHVVSFVKEIEAVANANQIPFDILAKEILSNLSPVEVKSVESGSKTVEQVNETETEQTVNPVV